MIGIIPAAGAGERIQPLGCSKELLPVGSRSLDGAERPKAVCEYLVERMIAAGAEQICMVISAEKADIVRYFASRTYTAEIFYAVQQRPEGLCDAIFRAQPFTRGHDAVLIGLPDTLWFPENAFLSALDFAATPVNLVLFPVNDASAFDAAVCDEFGFLQRVEVKKSAPACNWIWGAVATTSQALHDLRSLWDSRHHRDQYLGDLLNAYLAAGNLVRGVYSGELYMDVGTVAGYHAALDYLRSLRERQAA